MLENPEAVARIRDASGYLDSQPDLDIYNKAFEGYGLSEKFKGSDVDGLFCIVSRLHGVWERNGYLLFQEHKRGGEVSVGQSILLRGVAGLNTERAIAICTFGDTNNPSKQRWCRVFPDSNGPMWDMTEDTETWPHSMFIQRATNIIKNPTMIARLDMRKDPNKPTPDWIKRLTR